MPFFEGFTCSQTGNSFSSEPPLSCRPLAGGDPLKFLSCAVSEVIAGDLNGGMDLLALLITWGGKENNNNNKSVICLPLG